jgi:hypothetical protein
LERINFLFENLEYDFYDLMKFECELDPDELELLLYYPYSAQQAKNRLINYESFIETNFPGSNLEISELLDSLENDDRFTLIIDDEELNITYNMDEISLNLLNEFNVTLEFKGNTTNITWSPETTGPVQVCVFTPNLDDCIYKGESGSTVATIQVNNTNLEPAGTISVNVTGVSDVQISFTSLDLDLIPSVDVKIDSSVEEAPSLIKGARMIYDLTSAKRDAPVPTCK